MKNSLSLLQLSERLAISSATDPCVINCHWAVQYVVSSVFWWKCEIEVGKNSRSTLLSPIWLGLLTRFPFRNKWRSYACLMLCSRPLVFVCHDLLVCTGGVVWRVKSDWRLSLVKETDIVRRPRSVSHFYRMWYSSYRQKSFTAERIPPIRCLWKISVLVRIAIRYNWLLHFSNVRWSV